MEKIITIDLDDVIGLSFEGFLDLLEERCGGNVLEDISYKVIGGGGSGIVVQVNAKEVEL